MPANDLMVRYHTMLYESLQHAVPCRSKHNGTGNNQNKTIRKLDQAGSGAIFIYLARALAGQD
jgi:hypothetical protein